MKIKKFYFVVSIITIFILQSCCMDEKGKIPITTTSCEARENYILGMNYAQNLQNEKALIYYNKAIEQDSNFAMAYFGKAIVQNTTSDIFKYLNKAVALADQVSEGERLIILGMQAGFNREIEKQKQLYEKLVLKYPNDEIAIFQLGNYYFMQQNYEKAIEYYKEIIRINKNFAPVYNVYGYCFRNLGEYKKAEKALKKYIQLIPDQPNPYDSYGELLLKMGEYEASIEQYEKALKRDSNFVASIIGIASNLVYKSEHKEALLLFERFYNKAKNDVQKQRALFGRAVIFVDDNKYDKAIQELEKSIKLSQKNNDYATISRAIVVIGAIKFELGQYQEALDYFKRSLKIIEKSDLPDEFKINSRFNYLFGESLVHANLKKFNSAKEKAQEFLNEAKRIGSPIQTRNGHELFGRIAFQMGNFKLAVEELKKANLENPYNLYRIGLSYERLNNLEMAKSYFEKAKDFNSFLNMNYSFCRIKARNKLVDLQ